MATQYMKDKPTAEDFAYAYAETADGALVRVPKSNVAGSEVTVDSELSETSTNPVQNKVVTGKFNELSQKLASDYYTQTQIDAMEFITVEDIDTIWGTTIQMASEVTF